MTAGSCPPVTVLRGRALLGSGIAENSAVAVAGTGILYAGPEAGLAAALSAAEVPAGDDLNTIALAPGQLAVPGLVDLHCHGGYGVDFPSADAAAARTALHRMRAAGTTTVLASLVTAAPADLFSGLEMLAGLAAAGDIAGIHLEGPFLAAARCGAQDPRWLLEPDLEFAQELVRAGRGQLRTMTYAPELPGADALVELLTASGVIPSLGHTACTAEQAHGSLKLAAKHLAASGGETVRPTVTHLFNGMDPIHHRAPGAVSACLRAAKAGTAAVELIADNTHLDPYLVAAMFDLLGAGNIALVTDSMAAAGLSDGQYRLGPAEVTVSGGVARLASTGSIAGGTAAMLDLVRNAVGAGVSLADAVTSAAAVPAGVLGRRDVGRLVAGGAADLVVIGPDLERVRVMRRGQWL